MFRAVTGTMQFMAIEVLQGKGHSYRHDLESFFYVFIRMCVRYSHGDASDGMEKAKERRARSITASKLHGWYTGTYSDIANSKRGHMDKNGFENIIAELHQSLRL